jgi:hypothetical protein
MHAVVEGTGEESGSEIIPFGLNVGTETPPINNVETHTVYFSADNLDIEKITLQIAP